MEEFRAYGFRMRVQGPGSQQAFCLAEVIMKDPIIQLRPYVNRLMHTRPLRSVTALGLCLYVAISMWIIVILPRKVRKMVDICAFIS